MIHIHLLTGLLVCLFAAGCATTRSQFTDLSSRFSMSDPQSDPLVLDKETLSEGFQKALGRFASKGLKNPEATNLAFARWKEDMGQYAESKRRYHEILTANPDCLPARLGIAHIERETGRFDQCREILNAARKQHPNDPTVMLELGRMYNERQQWDDSVRSFTKAVELASDDQMVHYELGLALASANRMEEALLHLKFAVGDSAALYNIAFILHECGRSAEAVKWVERAMDAHPDGRTRQMAGELLAELSHDLPTAPAFSQTVTAAPASQETLSEPPEIRAAYTGPNRARRLRNTERDRIPTQPAVTTRTYPAPALSGTVVRPESAVVAYKTTPMENTAPPQWSGPWNRQSGSTRPTQTQMPVRWTGYSRPTAPSQMTVPPVWRR